MDIKYPAPVEYILQIKRSLGEKVLETPYWCLDTGRSNLCFLGEKNVVRTIYARLSVIASILAIIFVVLSFYSLLPISPFLLVVYLFLAPFVPFKMSRIVRGVMAFFGWGAFTLMTYFAIAIIGIILHPTSPIVYEEWFYNLLLYSPLSIVVLGTALAVTLKPVTGLEVEKDHRKYRFTWWIIKRYYFLKLLWNL